MKPAKNSKNIEEKTMWERIADALKLHGISVFPPATKVGECEKEYVVVKADGSSQIGTLSSEVHYYTVLIYVPRNTFTRLEKFKKEIKDIFATDLYPMLMPTGSETPDFYDDTVKAHMVSITYRNNVRNKHL